MAKGAYENLIRDQAMRLGVNPKTALAFARIESGLNPTVKTGSYRGLFQLSPQQFRQHGGRGDIFDPTENAKAGITKMVAMREDFSRRMGRAPTPTELYMMHQQGPGGQAAHYKNPDQPAWKSMHSTAEGRQKGPAWAKRAIWGNVPTDVRKRYGSVENMTSADFVKMWQEKVNRFGAAPEAPNAPPSASLSGLSGNADLGGINPTPAAPAPTPYGAGIGPAASSFRAAQSEYPNLPYAGGTGPAAGSPRAAQEQGVTSAPIGVGPLGGSGPVGGAAPVAPIGPTFSQLMAEGWQSNMDNNEINDMINRRLPKPKPQAMAKAPSYNNIMGNLLGGFG